MYHTQSERVLSNANRKDTLSGCTTLYGRFASSGPYCASKCPRTPSRYTVTGSRSAVQR